MKIIIFLASLTLSSVCLAQVPIEKGQPAPENGVFLTNNQAAKLIAEKNAVDKICEVNKTYAVEIEKQQCVLDKKTLQNEVDYQKSKYDQIIKIRDENEKDLYRKIGDGGNNLYWFAGGIAAGATTVVVSVATVYLIMNSGK